MYFDCKYRIFPAGKPCKLVLVPCFPVTVDPAVAYEAELHPFSCLRRYGLRDRDNAPTAADAAFFSARRFFCQTSSPTTMMTANTIR